MHPKALTESNSLLNAVTAIQLCYDGRVVFNMDCYNFLSQFTDEYDQKHDSVMAVKSFRNYVSVKTALLFNTISKKACSNSLSYVCFVMANTFSLNTGKKTGAKKRLVDHFDTKIGHGIHALE